jgi:hypothetical protein
MKTVTLLALWCALAIPACATHLLGGQIQVRNLSGNTYEIKIALFMDGGVAADASSSIPLCLGDGSTITVSRTARQNIDQSISYNIYQTSYTYNGPGVYLITASIQSRSMTTNASPATDVPFVLCTTLQAAGGLRNSAPVFEPSPQFWQLGVNQRATLNFSAVDADGDSLSYSLSRPLINTPAGSCTAPFGLNQYQYPNEVARAGTYTLNARSGELVWDAPTRAGQYTATVVIREWRNGVQIGETYVEMALRVQDKGGATTPIPPFAPATEFPSLVTGNESEANFTFVVLPNPTQNHLTAQLRLNKASSAYLQLHDLSGRLVDQKELTPLKRDHEHTFNLGNLPSGTYVLKATVAGRILSRTVVKQ